MSEPGPTRHLSLDAIRGVAVMGILLLNIFGFAMPQAAYTNPFAWGGTAPADIAAWAVGFVMFEGKMRALFSMLFGASAALIIDRARASGDRGATAHFPRMAWLLIFGLAHHLLVWEGDILVQYAIVGAVAFAFSSLSNRVLVRWSFGLLLASVLMHGAIMAGAYLLRAEAAAPNASEKARRTYANMEASFSQPGSAGVAQDLKDLRRDYPAIRDARIREAPGSIGGVLSVFGLETLGLMLAGMALLRSGFLTGEWPQARYRRWAIRAYLVGIPPTLALAAWNWASGFDTLATFSTFFAWVEPFRYATTLGHAALAMLLLHRFANSPLVARIAAAGRTAFTNYLVTSIVMTTIFYGYGGGLFGQVGRAELYLFVFAMWAAMLAWSKPWLARFRYGPFEWAWRSLSRAKLQPMRA